MIAQDDLFFDIQSRFLDTSAKQMFTNMPGSQANGLFYGFTGSFSTKL